MTDRDQQKLIGLVGYPGVGKDSLADYLVDQYGWAKVAFGDAVKQMLLRIDPAYGGDLAALESSKRDPGNVTRMKLQNLGQEIREIDPLYWVVQAKVTASEHLAAGRSVVISDVRYHNESAMLRHHLGRQGTLVSIAREGCGPVNDHVSETGTAELKREAHLAFSNNDTIASLAARVLTCV